MSHDDWSVPEDGEDEPVAPRPRASSCDGCSYEPERARRVARQEIIRSWREIGVDFSSYDKRQEHAGLIAWIRERKRMREAGASKLWTTAIGAVVSAVVAGLAAFLSSGFKH